LNSNSFLIQKGELEIKIAGTLLTKSALVERLWELSQEIKLSDVLKNEVVLLPEPLPTNEENNKVLNDKVLSGEIAEKWKEYDLAFLLHFIADMCED